jgi:hypothetical protein
MALRAAGRNRLFDLLTQVQHVGSRLILAVFVGDVA